MMYDSTVVRGIIEFEGSVLLAKKVKGWHPAGLGDKWHFPGGTVEQGESLEGALNRELGEETNLKTKVTGLLGWNPDVNTDGNNVRIIYYSCYPLTRNFRPSSDVKELKLVQKSNVLNELSKEYVDMLPNKVVSYFRVSSK